MDSIETVRNDFEGNLLQSLGIQKEDIIPVSGQLRVQLGGIDGNRKAYLLEPTKFEFKSTQLNLLYKEDYKGGFEIYLFNKNGVICIRFYKDSHSDWLIKNIDIIVFDGTSFDKSGRKSDRTIWKDVNFRVGSSKLTINRQGMVLDLNDVNVTGYNTNNTRGYVMHRQIIPDEPYKTLLKEIFKGENAGFCFRVENTDPTGLQESVILITLGSSFNAEALVVCREHF